MLRRNIRLRREYLYRKSLEGKECEYFEKKPKIREALEQGKPIPTELRNEAALRQEIDLEDEHTAISRSLIDDGYANATVKDPNELLTTSCSPSAPLTKFVKELKIVFPNARRMNHGGQKSMIGNPFPAKLVLSFSANQSELASAVGHYRKITTGISVSVEDLTKALEHFFSSEKHKVCCTKEMCSIFIEKLCKVGSLSDAWSLLQYLHNRQIHPDLNTYNTLLAAAGETSNFDLFCDIFQKLLLSKLPPDLTSYLNVSKVLPSLSDSKLLKFIGEVSETTAHSEPTVVNRIIFVAAKSGQIDRSVMMFEELKNHECKIDTVTFNTVLAILGRAGRADKMLSEFSLMKKLGFSPNIVTYDTLINCLRRLGRLDLCKTFAKEMLDRGFKLDLQAYTALIDGLGRAGHVNDAMMLFGEMKKCHCPSIYVYRAMISNLKKFGKIEAAMDLLKEMNSSTTKLIGPEDFRKRRGSVRE